MAGQFDFLAKAKPASLYKLLEKLPTDEAAIVLTGLPHTLAIQSLAFFPEDLQGMFLPLMREARNVPAQERDEVAGKIRTMLGAAKAAKDGKTQVIPKPDVAHAAQTPGPASAPAKAAKPGIAATLNKVQNTAPLNPIVPPPTPPQTMHSSEQPAQPAPVPPQAMKPPVAKNPMAGMANPYEAAPPPKAPLPEKNAAQTPAASPLAGLGAKLKDVINKAAASASAATQKTPQTPSQTPPQSPPQTARPKPEPRPANFGKPMPWVPRTATSSPINGPALPGKPPPVSGDPFTSPLARAGLLDLIGRAQEKLLPKGTVRRADNAARPAMRHPQQRPRVGKDGRPKPREGLALPGEVEFSKTPRVIGPRPRQREEPRTAAGEGARRMDGKAILAAILREAGPEVRGSVQDEDPMLMRELRGRMFYFDDLIYTEDAALAKVFTAAPAETAALALKFAAPELRRRVLGAVSPGRARALEDTSKRAGFDAVEAAQKKVLDVALQLQAAGRILIDPRDPDLIG